MAIAGIGTDIVETARFLPERLSGRGRARIFTDGERAYCDAQRYPERHYAARFAAKEAAVKALASLMPGLVISQVEVVRLPSGAPVLRLVAGLASSAPPAFPTGLRLHVTLSHSDAYATATVVAELLD
jgi:holo-[acyl-carrier protein] synthase